MGFDISLRLMNNNPIEMSLTEGEAKFVLEGLEIANHPIYIDRIPPSSAIDAALALNEELLKENIPKFRKLKIFNYEADLRYKIVGSDKDYHLHLKGQTSF